MEIPVFQLQASSLSFFSLLSILHSFIARHSIKSLMTLTGTPLAHWGYCEPLPTFYPQISEQSSSLAVHCLTAVEKEETKFRDKAWKGSQATWELTSDPATSTHLSFSPVPTKFRQANQVHFFSCSEIWINIAALNHEAGL